MQKNTNFIIVASNMIDDAKNKMRNIEIYFPFCVKATRFVSVGLLAAVGTLNKTNGW